MTDAVKTRKRPRRGIRRLAAAAGAAALALTAIAAGAPAFAQAAASAPVAAETQFVDVQPIVAQRVERGAPGVGLSVFLGSALTLGAGGIVTARLLAHKHHVAEAKARS